jgi:uncharacterized protein (TIGR02246 family)
LTPSGPATPEDLPRLFAEAWNRRDPDALAELFEPDAEFVNVTGIWWHDREAIREAHAYGLSRIFPDSTLRIMHTRVKWLADTVAVVHARLRLEGQSPVGEVEAPGSRSSIFSFVARLGAEGWRCASAQNTEIVPGKETLVRDASGQLQAMDYRRPEDT